MLLSGASAITHAGGEIWNYEGDRGPAAWGSLSPGWAVCSNGRYQSPIDLKDGIPVELGSVSADIKASTLKFGLDGPTFAVPYESGSMLSMNDTNYELRQFHFHHQSEHTVNGRHYPMEAHLVMRSEGSDHNDAVMGIFIKTGRENAMLNQFWDQLPRASHDGVKPVQVNIGELLPKDTAYFMYEGSMTTPDCHQGVRWFVLEQPVEASQAQIDRFIDDFIEGESNNRPVQPSYARAILKGKR
jgi:carbonic anhydrase